MAEGPEHFAAADWMSAVVMSAVGFGFARVAAGAAHMPSLRYPQSLAS
jgi:hypothetical protein